METPVRVVHFHRKPTFHFFSLERVFADVRAAEPPGVVIEERRCRYESRGIWRRVYDVCEAALHQGDVNHVTGDILFVTLLMDRRRTVLTIPDCGTLDRMTGLARWVYWLFWYWLPVRRCRAITVISEATKRELLRHVRCDPARIHVIHCSLSDAFRSAPHEFDASHPRLLQVGVSPNKNLERVAAALRGIPCRLAIVGRLSDAQRHVLAENGIDYESVAGLSDEELVQQYRDADMVLFASTYEGFGLPIIEANAVGRPVVTSDLLSMPEVAGDAACLVDPFDVQSIRAGILRVIEDADYRAGLVAAGFRNVEKFRPAAIAAQYAQLYREIARENAVSRA